MLLRFLRAASCLCEVGRFGWEVAKLKNIIIRLSICISRFKVRRFGWGNFKERNLSMYWLAVWGFEDIIFIIILFKSFEVSDFGILLG